MSLWVVLLLNGCAKRPYYAGFLFDSPVLVETDRSEYGPVRWTGS